MSQPRRPSREPKPRRPEDREYDVSMHCEKAYDMKHHFVPRYIGERVDGKVLNVIYCTECGIPYSPAKHTPPLGYKG
jgi:hypothetical protein